MLFNPGDLVRLKPEYWQWYRENVSPFGPSLKQGDTLYVQYQGCAQLYDNEPEYVRVEEIGSCPTSANCPNRFVELVKRVDE